MPDTMAAPVVKELFIDRYGASPSLAQFFNGVNLLGAVAALPLLWTSRRRLSSVSLVVWASIADALLLGSMALPLGLGWTLVARGLEGVTDVIVFAALFDLVRSHSRGHVATGMGVASTPLLLGLGLGAILGGFVVRQSSGGSIPVWLFGYSALLSGVVGVIAWARRDLLQGGEAAAQSTIEVSVGSPTALEPARDPLWPALAMTFSDRATGGLITGTLPIALAQLLGYSPFARGVLVGLPLLLMALGTGPAGVLCDRFGSLRVRVIAGIAYASAFGLLSVTGDNPLPLGLVMVVIGLAGSVLFSSSIALAIRCGPATIALGAFRGAGDLGFLSGTVLSVLLLSSFGGESPTHASYALLLTVFACFHGATTLVAGLALKSARRANGSSLVR